MKVLVTGSSGLIGSEAVKYYDGRATEVIGVDNNMRREFFGVDGDTTWNREQLQASCTRFEHVEADIRDRQAMAKLIRRTRPGRSRWRPRGDHRREAEYREDYGGETRHRQRHARRAANQHPSRDDARGPGFCDVRHNELTQNSRPDRSSIDPSFTPNSSRVKDQFTGQSGMMGGEARGRWAAAGTPAGYETLCHAAAAGVARRVRGAFDAGQPPPRREELTHRTTGVDQDFVDAGDDSRYGSGHRFKVPQGKHVDAAEHRLVI